MAREQPPVVGLQGRNEQIVLTLSTRTIQELTLAHLRISRTANVQGELYIVDGDDPNVFAGQNHGQRVIHLMIPRTTAVRSGKPTR